MNLRDVMNKAMALATGGGRALTPVPPPKVPNKQQSFPGYRTQLAPSKSAIRRDDLRLASTDLLSFRTGRDTLGIVRNLVKSSPDLNAALSTALRVGIPEDYTCICRNMDGTINPQATQLVMQLIRRFTYVPDYSLGFNSQGSLQSISESLGKELIQNGALAGEIVLDKSRLPTQIAPVATTKIKFYEDDRGIRPVQDMGGTEIDLDIATFIYVSVDQDLLDAYSSSYLEAAIQPVIADSEFTNDLRRVLKRATLPRLTASIIEEDIKNSLPTEILSDPAKYAAYLQEIIAQVEQTVNGLNPEDALVSFNSIEYKHLEGQNQNLHEIFSTVQNLLNSKMSSGAKTLPAILGHDNSSNAASAQSMLYLKHADLIRRKLNEFWSRALTVSIRLFGLDVYVDFNFARLDLRPDSELEAFRSMYQSRVADQLSWGMLSDETACVMLTGQLPPPGMPKLSGTMFRPSAGTDPSLIENPVSGTSTMNRNDPPSKPKGPANKTKAEVFPIRSTE